jgi:hypothetical protein
VNEGQIKENNASRKVGEELAVVIGLLLVMTLSRAHWCRPVRWGAPLYRWSGASEEQQQRSACSSTRLGGSGVREDLLSSCKAMHLLLASLPPRPPAHHLHASLGMERCTCI